MDAYDRFCERDAADERAEDALARYEAEFANEGADEYAAAVNERASYELRDVTGWAA